jgi:hypothetical protein
VLAVAVWQYRGSAAASDGQPDAERIARDEVKRQACWTESLAVGSQGFVERIQPLVQSRRETEVVAAAGNGWALQEAASSRPQIRL